MVVAMLTFTRVHSEVPESTNGDFQGHHMYCTYMSNCRLVQVIASGSTLQEDAVHERNPIITQSLLTSSTSTLYKQLLQVHGGKGELSPDSYLGSPSGGARWSASEGTRLLAGFGRCMCRVLYTYLPLWLHICHSPPFAHGLV